MGVGGNSMGPDVEQCSQASAEKAPWPAVVVSSKSSAEQTSRTGDGGKGPGQVEGRGQMRVKNLVQGRVVGGCRVNVDTCLRDVATICLYFNYSHSGPTKSQCTL